MWRLMTRRAGRRTMATVGGVGVLWIVAVMLLPSVLPPSLHTSSQALPPAHRRIHQQQPDPDYTGFKLGLLKQPPQKKGIINTADGVSTENGGLLSNNIEKASNTLIKDDFPMKERGSMDLVDKKKSNHNFLETIISQPHEPSLLMLPENKPIYNKNVVFAQIKPNINLEVEVMYDANREIIPVISDSAHDSLSVNLASLNESGKRQRNGHQNPKRQRSTNDTQNEVSSVLSNKDDDDSNTAGEVDRAKELSNAAEDPETAKQEGDNGEEGPYTIPILKTPKEGGAPPKVSRWQ